MKVVLLAGGYGTRLSEYTDKIPKPMVQIGGKPVVWHIMERYAKFGHKDFFLALGYKSEIIKEYFLNYSLYNSDYTLDLKSGEVTKYGEPLVDWRVTAVQTGLNTMTGGRLKALQNFIGNETFMLTYGDGLSDVDMNSLLKFHKGHGKLATVTAVHPAARFGELDVSGDTVTSFKEKPQLKTGWVNGGFFVLEPEFFDFIDGDDSVLEAEPLEQVALNGQLMAYKHRGFWQCMDTKRDKDLLEGIWKSGIAPWTL